VEGDMMMIHFPRKRCLSISTTRAMQPWNQEAEKTATLKYFEVHGI
jgi:hypothetical protein